MDYRILANTAEECFVEISKDSFRTRIEFNWTPEDDFRGVAVCCNYHYRGHPLGFIKDNSLVRRQVDGKRQRGLFMIPETDSMIQAGPVFVCKGMMKKDFESEGFSTHEILKGFQVHIARRRSGHYIVGFTKNNTFHELIHKYMDFSCEEAIKLPGHSKGSFLLVTAQQRIQHGVFPIPVALIFESRLKKASDIAS